MPRSSSEDQSGAVWRNGGVPPEPPPHLDKEAAAVWREIAASKPVDWFDAGAQVLLAEYCDAAVHARGLNRELAKLRRKREWHELADYERRAARASARLVSLATKLRLSVQASVDRRSRKLDERGPGAAGGDPLLGGRAVHGGKATN